MARDERDDSDGGAEVAAHRRTVCPKLARGARAPDDHTMRNERRHRRADTASKALEYQLLSCCEDGRIEAMVVADGDGLPLASSGDTYACDEVAARMVLVGPRIREFNGTLLGAGHAWQVQMTKILVDGTELLVCAVGGTADARKKQITRGAEGAVRILASAA
jgi:hypothetical protein